VLNPKLAIRQKEEWIDIYRHANIGLFADPGSESGQYILNVAKFLLPEDNPSEHFS
jgi:hypothetical protein